MKLFKFLQDTFLIFHRTVLTILRNPLRIIIFGLFQPICFLFLFAPMLDSLVKVPGFPPGGSLGVFTPGLLILMAIYSSAFVGFGLISDIRNGVINRMRVTPASRLALLLGRSLTDVFILLIQSIILLIIASFLGLKLYIPGVILSLILVMLVGLMISSFSYTIAMLTKNEFMLAPIINLFLIPLQLNSGITLPLSLAPAWINKIALFNPLAYAVSAARELFNGNLTSSVVITGFAITLLMACFAVYLASRTFKNLNS